jgi:hypothetical protein
MAVSHVGVTIITQNHEVHGLLERQVISFLTGRTSCTKSLFMRVVWSIRRGTGNFVPVYGSILPETYQNMDGQRLGALKVHS